MGCGGDPTCSARATTDRRLNTSQRHAPHRVVAARVRVSAMCDGCACAVELCPPGACGQPNHPNDNDGEHDDLKYVEHRIHIRYSLALRNREILVFCDC